MDKLISALANLTYDKLFQRLVKLCKGKPTTRIAQIKKNHWATLKIDVGVYFIQKKMNGVWSRHPQVEWCTGFQGLRMKSAKAATCSAKLARRASMTTDKSRPRRTLHNMQAYSCRHSQNLFSNIGNSALHEFLWDDTSSGERPAPHAWKHQGLAGDNELPAAHGNSENDCNHLNGNWTSFKRRLFGRGCWQWGNWHWMQWRSATARKAQAAFQKWQKNQKTSLLKSRTGSTQQRSQDCQLQMPA